MSYPQDASLSWEDLTAYVRQRLPAEAPYALVAESFSGPVAIRLAAERPVGLRALILAASFVRSPVGSFGPLNGLLAATLRVRPPRWAVRRFLVGADASPMLVDRVRAVIGSVDRRVLARRLRLVLDVDVSVQLAATTAPLLYLAAQRDRLVGPRALSRVRRLRPDLCVVRLDAPHLVLQRSPQEAAREIEAFLTRVASSSCAGSS